MPSKETYDAEMQKLYNDMVKKGTDDSVPKLPIVCPTVFNKPCRLCDLSKTILFRKDNEGSPERDKASSLNRKQSYYSNVILPSNPSDIVVLQYGHSVWKELMLFQMGPGSEVTDWLDPIKGRNVILTKTSVPGNKRRTTYSTKTRVNASPLPDMSVLRKLSLPVYQLDNILDLIIGEKVKPMYQSQLADGPNEIRFLPSWLGPGITKFFQLILYHYGLTKEEFDLIQKGEYNPFVGLGFEEAATEPTHTRVIPAAPVQVKNTVSAAPKSLWDEYVQEEATPRAPSATVSPSAEPNHKPTEEGGNFPPCYGKLYDPEDAECTVDCQQDGWAESCQTLTEQSKQKQLSKRRTAKRLLP